MDLLSHALIGAATAVLAARTSETRTAAFAGAAAALLPDVDALIRSSADPLMYFEYHRHFTHSLIFIPIGALIVAVLLRVLLRGVGFPRLYLFCVLGIAFAGLLDACTSYGTHLLWPFADRRVAWNIVSVLDPVFTLLLAVPVMLAIRTARAPATSRWALCAIALGVIYLLLGLLQHQRALHMLERYVEEQALPAERLMVKPTFANLILWRGIVQTAGHMHVTAIRPGIFGPSRVYSGARAARLAVADLAAIPAASRLRGDIERFVFFSDELVTRVNPVLTHVNPVLTHVNTAGIQLGDARYSMLPDSLDPIWSIRFDTTQPDRPVTVVTNREMSPADRTRFVQMLTGQLQAQ